jgi:NADPH:quinone reductase-like Zn-dependent oxidoreductase
MKAVVCTKYGPPEVLKIKDVPKPMPKDNEVLVKIHATTCHIGDVRIRSFNVPFWQMIPFRLFLGLTKPKKSILGMELAGEIDSVGQNVQKFKIGDQIFATTGFEFGTYAEYRCFPEESTKIKKGMLLLMPSNMTYREAAAGVTTGGVTALMILKKADIEQGQKVLIYGASGSVGSYAVQIAKYFGAKVTGVCSTGNIEMVKSLGADRVIDYTKEDITQQEATFDVVFDSVGKLRPSHGKKILAKGGVFLNVMRDSGSGDTTTMEDLSFLRTLVEEEKLKAVIDRTYTLEQIVEAHRYVEDGHKKGHVVIDVVSQ